MAAVRRPDIRAGRGPLNDHGRMRGRCVERSIACREEARPGGRRGAGWPSWLRAAAFGRSWRQALSSSLPALPRSFVACAAWSFLRDRCDARALRRKRLVMGFAFRKSPVVIGLGGSKGKSPRCPELAGRSEAGRRKRRGFFKDAICLANSKGAQAPSESPLPAVRQAGIRPSYGWGNAASCGCVQVRRRLPARCCTEPPQAARSGRKSPLIPAGCPKATAANRKTPCARLASIFNHTCPYAVVIGNRRGTQRERDRPEIPMPFPICSPSVPDKPSNRLLRERTGKDRERKVNKWSRPGCPKPQGKPAIGGRLHTRFRPARRWRSDRKTRRYTLWDRRRMETATLAGGRCSESVPEVFPPSRRGNRK